MSRLRCVAQNVCSPGKTRIPPPLLIEGPPGSAKSFLMQVAMREFIGLLPAEVKHPSTFFELSAVSAHRCSVIGGTHIHALFGFRPCTSPFFVTPRQLVSNALSHLHRNAVARCFLQSIHVLALDEFCQIGAPTLLAMDAVLRSVRCNETLFGGVWVIACGDHYQNEPIGETPPLLSWFVRHNFSVARVFELYRARRDPILGCVIQAMRQPTLSVESINNILDAIQGNCTLLQNEAECEADTVWLLPTNAAVSNARTQWFEQASAEKCVRECEDFVMRAGTWHSTKDNQVRKVLNRLSTLSFECHIVLGANVSVNMNGNYGGHLVPNGATGRILEFNDKSVTVDIIAPVAIGVIHVVPVHSPIVISGHFQYMRRQYPIELQVACTIHSIQGATLRNITTYGDAVRHHLMWSRMMLFTLLTRVEFMKDIHIVSFDRSVFHTLLLHVTSWHKEVDSWLKACNLTPNPTAPSGLQRAENMRAMAQSSFTAPVVNPMPAPGMYVVYVIQSAMHKEMYIGMTQDMQHRLAMHNAGLCLTTKHRQDWMLRAYVFGFPPQHRLVHQFEILAQHYRLHRGQDHDVVQALSLAVAQFSEHNPSLQQMLCVRVCLH